MKILFLILFIFVSSNIQHTRFYTLYQLPYKTSFLRIAFLGGKGYFFLEKQKCYTRTNCTQTYYTRTIVESSNFTNIIEEKPLGALDPFANMLNFAPKVYNNQIFVLTTKKLYKYNQKFEIENETRMNALQFISADFFNNSIYIQNGEHLIQAVSPDDLNFKFEIYTPYIIRNFWGDENTYYSCQISRGQKSFLIINQTEKELNYNNLIYCFMYKKEIFFVNQMFNTFIIENLDKSKRIILYDDEFKGVIDDYIILSNSIVRFYSFLPFRLK